MIITPALTRVPYYRALLRAKSRWWNPFDSFRWQAGMPAWGAHTIITGGLHYVDEISFGYAYPIAAFARIVAEHPDPDCGVNMGPMPYATPMTSSKQ